MQRILASPASARPAAASQARALPARAPARPAPAAQPGPAPAWARLQTAGAAVALSAALALGGAPGALADLNKYEAAAGGEFGNGTALQYGEARPAAQVPSTGPGNVSAYHVAGGTGCASLQSIYRHSDASASEVRHMRCRAAFLTVSGRAGQHRRQGLPRLGVLQWLLSHHCRVWQACSPLARHARGTLSCESLTAPSHVQDLRRSNFTAADCRLCNFKNTNLQGSYFIKSVVPSANFEVSPLPMQGCAV